MPRRRPDRRSPADLRVIIGNPPPQPGRCAPSPIAALIVGALLRILILPIGVPAVDDSWRAWSYHAAMRGPWNLYGPRGHTVRFAGIDAPVVYPPLALDELAIVGRVHMAMHGQRFEDGVALTRTIKGTIVLLDAALATLLFIVVAASWRLAARVVGGDDVLGEPGRDDDHDARLHRRVFRDPGCRRPRRRIERPCVDRRRVLRGRCRHQTAGVVRRAGRRARAVECRRTGQPSGPAAPGRGRGVVTAAIIAAPVVAVGKLY